MSEAAQAYIDEVQWWPEEREAAKPKEKLKISEWSERYRVLSGSTAEKGPLRLKRTPYLIPILDACLDPDIETVIFCKAAQIAGTEGILSVFGYFAHQEPCPVMFVMADEKTAEYMSKERIQRMFRDSPELSKLIVEEQFNKLEMSMSNGAYISLAWASSVARLASRPIRVIAFDEVDKPGYYVITNEAGPISLGKERTETYTNRLIFITSTPTTEEGNIVNELKSCDVIFDWHVPCAVCGQFQPLRWSAKYGGMKYRDKHGAIKALGQVVWEGGHEATREQISDARYQCGSCGVKWTTIEKNNAVEKGIMSPRKDITHPPKKVGFHVNRLYSLLGHSGNLAKLVQDWIDAQDDPLKLQGFVNSTLAEPWKLIILKSSQEELLKAKCDLPAQTAPQEAIALTAGIDVQKYGFWFAVRAWAKDYTSWLIHYGPLTTWEDVETLLFESAYPIDGKEGQTMRIWRAGIDTGGGQTDEGPSMTEETYWWLRQHAIGRGARIWGTKGSSGTLAGSLHFGKPLEKTPSGKPLPGGLQIVSLDTAKLKDKIHYRLQHAISGEMQAAYLHAETGSDYASQILAEEKRRNNKGLEEWVQTKRDNHLLDCEVIAHACADPEWHGGIRILATSIAQDQNAKKGDDEQKRQPWIPGQRPGQWLRR